MEDLRKLVSDLYLFRDHYFESHDLSAAKDKSVKVQKNLSKCLEDMDKLLQQDSESGLASAISADSVLKAESLYLRGRALNITTEHCPEAEKILSRSVKLNPGLVEAWNELGECYWKRGAVETAQTCFEGAERHRSNKVSLRSLSIVMRSKSTKTPEERLRNIEQGLSKAREAVQLDTTDGQSWSILGNAYFAHFFNISQNPRTLKQAMTAYKQAEKDIIAKSTPELHYNKGVALRYEEDYEGALACFERAAALDPTWDDPRKQEMALLKSLQSIKFLIEAKGKLKTKRFNSFVESINSKSLGPYGYHVSNGSSATTNKSESSDAGSNTSSTVKLTEINFSELEEGSNDKKVVLGKVICSVHSEESVPFTFCLTDRKGRCLAVNLYNLSPGKGVIIGDTVAIPEPNFTKVSFKHGDKKLGFDLIRVNSPLTLVINGKRAGQDLQAGIELSTFTKSD